MSGGPAPAATARPAVLVTWRDFCQLTKLSISAASTLTSAAGYLAAGRGFHWSLAPMLAGTLLLAMGSCALNEVQEFRHDARMKRTCDRPLPSGRLSRPAALAIGLGLAAAGFAILLLACGGPAAALGLLALSWYAAVYTPLKRATAFAIIPGSVIGAIPPAIGWASSGAGLAAPALLSLCLVLFLWQVPHFWILMLLHDPDYRRAGYPTLARHFDGPRSARLTYAWLAAAACSPGFLPFFGTVASPAAAAALALAGLWLLGKGLPLLRPPESPAVLRRAFRDINLFALAVVLIVVMDPFLQLPPLRGPGPLQGGGANRIVQPGFGERGAQALSGVHVGRVVDPAQGPVEPHLPAPRQDRLAVAGLEPGQEGCFHDGPGAVAAGIGEAGLPVDGRGEPGHGQVGPGPGEMILQAGGDRPDILAGLLGQRLGERKAARLQVLAGDVVEQPQVRLHLRGRPLDVLRGAAALQPEQDGLVGLVPVGPGPGVVAQTDGVVGTLDGGGPGHQGKRRETEGEAQGEDGTEQRKAHGTP